MNAAVIETLNFQSFYVSPTLFKGFPMKNAFRKNAKKFLAAGAAVYGAAANAAVTMPTPAYTDIEAAAVVGFGIVITVALLVKAKSFLRG